MAGYRESELCVATEGCKAHRFLIGHMRAFFGKGYLDSGGNLSQHGYALRSLGNTITSTPQSMNWAK
jgi:hypothetical protein